MQQFTVNSFLKYLQKNMPGGLILLLGEEFFFHDFLLMQIEAQIFTNSSEKKLNYHVFYGTENTLAEVLSASFSYPMFANKKLVVVKEFDKLKIEDKEAFLKYIQKPQNSSVLVLIARNLGTAKIYKEITSMATVVSCKPLSQKEIYQWVQERFDEHKVKVDIESVAFLVENTGQSLLRINQEIEKLVNFVNHSKSVTVEIVSQLTGFTKDVNIFNFQKVLSGKNLQLSLETGFHLLEQGESLAGILPMLFRHFRRMLIVKQLLGKHYSQSQILSELKGSFYAFQDIFASVGEFTVDEILKIFEWLEQAEVQLKTSQNPESAILTVLCYRICNSTSLLKVENKIKEHNKNLTV